MANLNKFVRIVCLMCMFWAMMLLFKGQVDCQFFTKSSKSIPRMGRRSEASSMPQEARHAFIDSLIDEYGPNLVDYIDVSR